jgi:hypothetical protein
MNRETAAPRPVGHKLVEKLTFRDGLRMPFHEFWRHYLDAHRHPATRGMHYSATIVGAVTTVLAILHQEPLFCAGGIAFAVVMAVTSHWLVERNQPLIRVNALYGAMADLRMCYLGLTGGISAEYERLGLGAAAPIRRSSQPAE